MSTLHIYMYELMLLRCAVKLLIKHETKPIVESMRLLPKRNKSRNIFLIVYFVGD